jgi:hypothetical protein
VWGRGSLIFFLSVWLLTVFAVALPPPPPPPSFQGEDDFQLYESLTMTVKRFSALTTQQGLLNVAVVDHPKEFQLLGVGVAEGDMAMFVSAGAEEDSDCEAAVNSNVFTVQNNGTLPVLFHLPTMGSISGALQLCVKFSEEPYILRQEYRVQVRQILDTDKRIGLAGAFQPILLFGYGMQENDQVGWVNQEAVDGATVDLSVDGGHSVCSESLFPGTALTDNMPAYAFNVLAGGSSSLVKHSVAGNAQMLCYKFQDEPWHLYQNIQMNIAEPKIFSVSHASTTVGVSKELSIVGTVGITEEDKVMWVSNHATDCIDQESGVVAAEGQTAVSEISPVFDVGNVASGVTINSGTSTVDVTFTASSPAQKEWKLCYLFGGGPPNGPALFLPSLIMSAKAVDRAEALFETTDANSKVPRRSSLPPPPPPPLCRSCFVALQTRLEKHEGTFACLMPLKAFVYIRRGLEGM